MHTPGFTQRHVGDALQNEAEILVDDFDPEAHAQQTLVQKAEDTRNHAARMLLQTKVRPCMVLLS